MINVLIAPNSFKECSTSVYAAKLILSAFNKNLPDNVKRNFNFTTIPISDGGDGFLDVCENHFNLTSHSITLTAPFLKNKVKCRYGYSQTTKTIYIESALILGINIIPVQKRNPMILSSIGVGELLDYFAYEKIAGRLEIDKIIIGIGGTGTNDLGLGACGKFDFKMFDINGNVLEVLPENFLKTEKITFQKPALPFEIELILDVENPLLGKNGAAKTFGLQKGLNKNEIQIAEKGFENIFAKLKIDKSRIKSLSGAGGGLAAGMQFYFNAETKNAKQFIQKDLGINNEKYKFDIVITGEGKFDDQSLLSKGTMVVLNEFYDHTSKQFLLCGFSNIDDSKIPDINIIELQKFFHSKEESLSKIELGIELGVKKIINEILNKN